MKKIDYIVMVLVFLFIFQAQGSAVRAPDRRLYDWSGGLATNPNSLLLTNAMANSGKVFMKRLDNYFVKDGKLRPRGGTRAVYDSLERTVDTTGLKTYTGKITFVRTRKPPFDLNVVISVLQDSLAAKPGGWWVGQKIYNTDSTNSATILQYSPDSKDTLRFFAQIDNIVNFLVDTLIILEHDTLIQSKAEDTGSTSWVFGYIDKNRRQRLLTVAPSFGSENRWSALYASDVNGYKPKFKLWDYIYKEETPQAVQLGDRVFIALDRQAPIVFDGNVARLVVPSASGELQVAPITAVGNLNGTYKWGLVQAYGAGADTSDIFYRIGYVSTKTRFENEQSVIRGFPAVARDSIRDILHATNTNVGDTNYYYLVRTKGSPLGFVSPVDTFYTVKFLALHINVLDTFKYVDDTPDDSLGDVNHVIVSSLGDSISATIPPDTALIDALTQRQVGFSQIDSIFPHPRYSAPGGLSFLASAIDSTGWIGDDSTPNPNDSDWNVTEYMLVKVDTSLRSVSDSSSNLIIQHSFPLMKDDAQDSSITSITLGLPRVSNSEENTIRIIYRRQGYVARSARKYKLSDAITYVPSNPRPGEDLPIFDRWIVGSFFRVLTSERLIHGPYLPVGVIYSDSQTVFVDNMTWADALFHGISDTNDFVDPAWLPQSPIDNMKGFFSLGNQLYGWDDNFVYRATENEPGNFEVLSKFFVNTHDGDFLTACYGFGPNVVALKENSRTEIFNLKSGASVSSQVQNGTVNSDVQYGRGCVAERSLVQLGSRAYYLSNEGMVEESPREFKSFGANSRIISRSINSLLLGRRTPAQVASARVHANFNNLFLSYPGTETTFVYSLVDNAWSLFTNFDFNSITTYDTTSTEGRLPQSFMVLSRPGKERAFLFNDTNTFDWAGINGITGGEPIDYIFKTHALQHDGNMWRIGEIGIRYEALSTFGNESLWVKIYDEVGGGELDTLAFPWQSGGNSVEYLRRNCNPHMGYDLSIGGSTRATFRNDTFALLGIDVWLESAGEPKRE